MACTLLLSVGLVGGCQASRVASPLTKELTANDPDTQTEFWHRLQERPLSCNDEAFHGMLLYLSPENGDPSPDYATRLKVLKEKRLLPANFNRPADEAVGRGTLALMLCQILEIRGGLLMHVAGNSPRYATKELVYTGLYPPSSPNQTFSGAEFLGVIGKLEDQQRGDAADVPAAVMPDSVLPNGR